MDKMKKCINCVLFLVLAFMLLDKLNYVLRPQNTDQVISNIDAYHKLPENSVECLILGPSSSWRGINTLELYRMYGIGAYNYSSNWLHINTIELYLQDSLKTQKPKVIILETTKIEMHQIDNIDGEIYCTNSLKLSNKEKFSYVSDALGGDFLKALYYFFPIFTVHENIGNISYDSFVPYYSTEDFNMTMGYFYLPGEDKVTEVTLPDMSTVEQAELPEESENIMNRIANICKENDISLILLTMPQGSIPNIYHDALEEYAQKKGLTYVDLFYEIDNVGLDTKTDFYDRLHLNNSGAIKVSDYLGKVILKVKDLGDLRRDPSKNVLWEGKEDMKTGRE